GRFHHPLTRLAMDVADRHEKAARQAPLASAAVKGFGDDAYRSIQIRIGHDDDEVLGTAERLNALAGVRRPLVHVSRDRRGTDERDGADRSEEHTSELQ